MPFWSRLLESPLVSYFISKFGRVTYDSDDLIAGYTNAVSIVSDDGAGNFTFSITDTGVPGNAVSLGDPRSVFTNGTTSPKLCLQSDGTYDWSSHNLLTQSEVFSHADWTAPQAVSTSGSLPMTLTDNSAVDAQYILQSITTVVGAVYSVTYWIKKVASAPTVFPRIDLLDNGSSTNRYTLSINLQTGAVVEDLTDGGPWSYESIEDPEDSNYWRLTLSGPATTTTMITRLYPALKATIDGANDTSLTGSLDLLKVQFQRGNKFSGYYHTTTTAAVYGVATDYDQDEIAYSILHEPSATNINEESFVDAGFAGANRTLDVDTSEVTDPFGTNKAAKVTFSVANGYHTLTHPVGGCDLAASTEYTTRVMVRPGDRTAIFLTARGRTAGGYWAGAVFDLIPANTAATQTETGAGASTTLHGTSQRKIGDWYEITINYTLGAVTANEQYIVLGSVAGTTGQTFDSAVGQVSWNQTSSDYIYVGHFQTETGSNATTPIPTYGSSVTRDQDELTWDWDDECNHDAGGASTMYVKYKIPDDTGGYSTADGDSIIAIKEDDSFNKLQLDTGQDTGPSLVFDVTREGTSLGIPVAGVVGTAASATKVALAVATDDLEGTIDGTVATTDTGTATLTTTDQMRILSIGADGTANVCATPLRIFETLVAFERLDYGEIDYLMGTDTAKTGSGELLADYRNGIAIDADDGSGNFTYSVSDTGVPANGVYNGDPQTKLTNGTTSPKLCLQSDGTYKWSPHNLAENSTDPSSWVLTAVTESSGVITCGSGGTVHLARLQTTDATASSAIYTTVFTITPGNHDFIVVRNYEASEEFVSAVFDISDNTAGETDVGTTSGTYIDHGVNDNGDGTLDLWVTYTGLALDGASNDDVAVGFATAKTGNTFSATGSPTHVGAGTETFTANSVQVMRGTYQSDMTVFSTTTAAVYGVAADYDTDESEYSILSEPTATNSLTHSLPNTGWTASLCTLADSTYTAQSGRLAIKQTSTGLSSQSHIVYDTVSFAAGNYIMSAVVWGDNNEFPLLNCRVAAGNYASAIFDLSDTDATTASKTQSVTMTVNDTKQTFIGDPALPRTGSNNVYRISMNVTASGTITFVILMPANSATATMDSNGYATAASGEILHWGDIQFESTTTTSANPSSPIPTYGSSVTRDQDEIRLLWANTPYSTTAATFLMDFKGLNYNTSTFTMLYNSYNGADLNNTLAGVYRSGAQDVRMQSFVTGAAQCQLDLAWTTDTRHKMGASFEANDFVATVDGATSLTDISGTMPASSDRLDLGWHLTNGTKNATRFYSFVVVPSGFSAADLEAWTT